MPAEPSLVVHVVGQVRVPGLVELPQGARIADAVAAAGGATETADVGALNLARPVQDGEQVLVPAPGEQLPPEAAAGPAVTGTGTAAGSLVDLNTADLAALDALPGVGPVLAERILEWRGTNGGFTSVDDLDEVSGVGPAVLESLRPLVTV